MLLLIYSIMEYNIAGFELFVKTGYPIIVLLESAKR